MLLLVPFGNDRRNAQFPAVTFALMVANIAVYLMCLQTIGQENINQQFGFYYPENFSPMYILISMFVHSSPMHLCWNMLFLWLFGASVEDVLGRLNFSLLYIGSGFVAAWMHAFIVQKFVPAEAAIPILGASGAVAGILGVFIIRFYRTGIKVFFVYPLRWGTFSIPAMFGLGIWFIQQMAGGILYVAKPLLQSSSLAVAVLNRLLPEGIAYWSHIGGMVFGILIAVALQMRLKGRKEYLMNDAMSNLDLGRTWHAAEHMCAILACDPEDADVHASLAKTYAMQQDADLAIAHYQRCLELYLKNGEAEKAINSFKEMKLFYRNARLDLKSEYMIARHMEQTGQQESAIQLLKEISSAYPNTPEGEIALMKIGMIYLEDLNLPEEAIRYFELFLLEHPSSSLSAMVTKSLAKAQKE